MFNGCVIIAVTIGSMAWMALFSSCCFYRYHIVCMSRCECVLGCCGCLYLSVCSWDVCTHKWVWVDGWVVSVGVGV